MSIFVVILKFSLYSLEHVLSGQPIFSGHPYIPGD